MTVRWRPLLPHIGRDRRELDPLVRFFALGTRHKSSVPADSQLDLRRERAAKNESVFREINERINESAEPATFHLFVCECENRGCAETVVMTAQEYEDIRAHSNSFFVLPGHEEPLVDEVTETNERYLAVRKVGVGAAVAEHLDPRAR